ncbi:MAG TPA: PEGA domain-containing protein, partial [Kofleriaceae bacterium]|nr:PEGA domain-containing protein [Kofleriaceae bacterium]
RDRYGRMQYVIDALVEERFANGYRESASDLAQAIREVVPSGNTANPRTQHTDRPLTIMTRSLLLEKSQPRRSAPRLPDPLPDSGGQAVTTEYQAQLAAAEESSQSQSQSQSEAASQSEWGHAQPAAALFEIPPLARADGTPMPPFRLSAGMMPSSDLASVIGGHTVTGTGHQGTEAVESRSHRLAFIVLGIATLVGAVAAVVMQVGDDATPPTEQAAMVKTSTPPPVVASVQDDHAVKPDDTTPSDPTPPAPPVDTKETAPTAPAADDKTKPVAEAAKPPADKPATKDDGAKAIAKDDAAKPATKDDSAKTKDDKPEVPARKANGAGAVAGAPTAKKKVGCQSPEHVDPFDTRPLCTYGELTAVRIWSKPWATVTIDDVYQGETPSLVVKVARGKHVLRLTTSTGVTKREMINVGKEVQTLRFNMEDEDR